VVFTTLVMVFGLAPAALGVQQVPTEPEPVATDPPDPFAGLMPLTPGMTPDPTTPTVPVNPSTDPPADPADPADPTAPAPTTVVYHGVQVTVPDGWDLVDLEADPTACPRLDRTVVYLGVAAEPVCPTTSLDRTTTLSLFPAAELPPGAVTALVGQVPELTGEQRTAGELVVALAGTDLVAVASFGGDPTPALVALGALLPVGRAAAVAPAPAAAVVPLDKSVTWAHGEGFDACTAPSLGQMQAWLASPYRAVGVYIGGGARACAQTNLTTSWMSQVTGMGWSTVPIYVGRQASCTSFSFRVTPGLEWEQGRDAALDAIAKASALGLPPGSDIYYDMESYPSSCTASVRAFLTSWTDTLHYNKYSSGVYSSLSTGIKDLADAWGKPGYSPPDKIWFARWSSPVSKALYGQTGLPDNLWKDSQRGRQYQGGHNETHGGVLINIDSNLFNTDSRGGRPTGQLESVRAAPGTVRVGGWAIDPRSQETITIQVYVDGRLRTTVWANKSRPDVGAAYPLAGSAHGFDTSVSATAGSRSVCVYAVNTAAGTNVTLGCKKVTVPAPNPIGRTEITKGVVGGVEVGGWAIDPATNDPLIVQAYVDGKLATMVWATRSRPDVAKAYPWAGPNHGFSLSLSTSPGSRQVCVYAVSMVRDASSAFGCQKVNALPVQPAGRTELVKGGAGSVDVAGWAIDPLTKDPVIVQVYLDGKLATMVWATRSRPDVGKAYPSAGPNHGFSESVAASAGQHQVCVYAVSMARGTSSSFGCQTASVNSGKPLGRVEALSATTGKVTAAGWTVDPLNADAMVVQVYSDGVLASMAYATGARPDVAKVYPWAGPNHGFSITSAVRAGQHNVCVYSVNVKRQTNSSFGCQTVRVP